MENKEVRILGLGDAHGMDFPGLKNIIKENKIDFIVCTGDLPNADEYRRIVFDNWLLIGVLGLGVHQLIGMDNYRKMVSKSVKSQDSIIKRLGKPREKTFLVYGNNDYIRKDVSNQKSIGIEIESLEEKIKPYKNIILLKKRVANHTGLRIIGHSGEFYNETKKMQFEKKALIKLFKKSEPHRTIFLTHEPPKGIMDRIGMKGSPLFGEHAGNSTYLELIKKFQPLMHLCGHIHEGFGKKKVGRTLVINLGTLQDKRYMIIKIKGTKITTKNRRL